MQTSTKVALGAVGVLGIGTAIVLWPKKAKAGTPGAPGEPAPGGIKPVTKDSGPELIQACVDGTKEGSLAGSKDGASSSEFEAPMPRLGYSSNMLVQAKFEQCYQDAYTSAFKISKKVLDKKFKTDEVVPTGAEMSTARGAGYSAGQEQGRLDALSYHKYEINYARVPSGYRPMPSNSSLAKEWSIGYSGGYGVGFSAASAGDTGTPDPYGTPGEDDEDGFGEVLGEYIRVGGKIIPRTRVGAMFMSKTPAGRRKIGTMAKPTPFFTKAPGDYEKGRKAGYAFCEKWYADPSRADKSAGHVVAYVLKDKSEDYKKGFYVGKEACEKARAKGPTVFNEEYERGRSFGHQMCAKHGKSWWGSSIPDRGTVIPRNDFERGYRDGLKEAGCNVDRAVAPSQEAVLQEGVATIPGALSAFLRARAGMESRTRVGAMFMSKTPAGRRKFGTGTTRNYESGMAKGYSDCKKWILAGRPGTFPGYTSRPVHPMVNNSDWYSGYMAGWEKCRKEPTMRAGELRVPNTGMESVERPATRMPLLRAIALPVTNIYDRARGTYRHLATRGLVSGALSSRAYYE